MFPICDCLVETEDPAYHEEDCRWKRYILEKTKPTTEGKWTQIPTPAHLLQENSDV